MIRIHHGALDEIGDGDIVLRGVLDNATLGELRIDDYQREAFPISTLGSIMGALRKGASLPDIELGMRGLNYVEPTPGVFELADPIYIVDGQQRWTAVKHHLKEGKPPAPRLGCTLYFGTTKEWERDRFRILNLYRLRVAPSVLLHNMREESMPILTLFGICRTEASAIHGRVCWQQNMLKGHLMTAMTLASTTAQLHAHCGPHRGVAIASLVPQLNQLCTKITLTAYRANVETFYETIDRAWGLRNITYKAGATYMRRCFLETFARFLSDHYDFWEGDGPYLLRIPYSLRAKIGTFPVKDPEVARLSGASGKAQQILYQLMVDHINSGKRTQRLRHRNARPVNVFTDYGDEDDREIDAA